jgi:peptidoglycan/xylan/chitin deacetylase (PgdA/CDA1 family)
MADEVSRLEAQGEGVKVSSLLYHDVVVPDAVNESGFPGADADAYKLLLGEFTEHLEKIRARTGGQAVSVFDILGQRTGARDFLLTFDDGGSSGTAHVQPMLATLNWVGHFFITTDYIGRPGFLTAHEIRELFRAGHVIGSHSCSHPPMISRCTREQLQREWGDSVKVLSDIVGTEVTTASIPAGFYSRAVAETAAEAGIRVLFTSEPVMSMRRSAECMLLGRYSIQHGTPAEKAAALAAGEMAATLGQAVLWNAKKPLKTLGGRYWLWFRKAVFARLR